VGGQELGRVLREVSCDCPDEQFAGTVVRLLVDKIIDATQYPASGPGSAGGPGSYTRAGQGPGGGTASLSYRPYLDALSMVVSLQDREKLMQIRLESM
jgi:hypothetical protein